MPRTLHTVVFCVVSHLPALHTHCGAPDALPPVPDPPSCGHRPLCWFAACACRPRIPSVQPVGLSALLDSTPEMPPACVPDSAGCFLRALRGILHPHGNVSESWPVPMPGVLPYDAVPVPAAGMRRFCAARSIWLFVPPHAASNMPFHIPGAVPGCAPGMPPDIAGIFHAVCETSGTAPPEALMPGRWQAGSSFPFFCSAIWPQQAPTHPDGSLPRIRGRYRQ